MALCARKAASGLNPGGVLPVQKILLSDGKDGPEFPALFALNMLLGTDNRRSYSDRKIGGMPSATGLSRVARLDFCGPNGGGVAAGV